MRQELIYSMKNIHRDDFNIYGYRFGKNGVKAACIVGSLRGHEVQQLYICWSSCSRILSCTAVSWGIMRFW